MSGDDTVLDDPRAIKALAHPARLAILEYLGDRESATATECAEITGLSPSATSYHLRALARYGLVTEAEGADKRERRWSSSGNFRVADDQADDPALRAAARLLGEQVMARGDQRYRDYLHRGDTEPPEWWNATTLSENRLRMTAEEAHTLSRDIADLLRPYARDAREAPADARDVQFSYRLFPLPDA